MIFNWYSRQNQHNYGKSPGKSPKYLFQTWNHSRFQLNPAKLLASSLRNWCCSQWSPPRISTPAASCKSFLGQCWKVPGSRSYYSSASTRIWPMLGTKTTHETVWKPSSFHNMRFFLSCLLQKKEQMKHARRATSSQATKKGQWIHLRNSKNPNMKVTSQNCIWNRRIGRESLSICLDSLEDTCVIHCPFDWTVQ